MSNGASMTTAVVAILSCLATFAASAGTDRTSRVADTSKSEQRIFYLLNLERKLAGLKKLEWNEPAAQAARKHAALLAKHGELSHQFPGELPLRDRLASTSVRFTSAAENVALADNEDEAHLALMYSDGHRENILNKNYSAAGIGIVEHAGRLYVTEDFVRLVPVFGEEEFQTALIAEFNRAREGKGMKSLPVQKDSFLHHAACSTHGDAMALPPKLGFSGELVVFNLSEPDQLPAELLKRAYDRSLSRMNIGVCFRPDPEHGNGNFWVVGAFAR
jgi:uncharacterized protein YkwD